MAFQLSGTAPVPARYGVAVLMVAAATLLRFALMPLVGLDFPFHTYWLVVAIVSYWVGAGPALTAAALGVGAARFFFIVPLHSFGIPDKGLIFRAIFYLFYCLGIIAITSTLRNEHKQAEAARLRAADAELRVNSILDSIHDGFALFDSAWRFVHMNPRAIEIAHRPLAELRSQSVWELYPELVGGEFHRALLKAKQDRARSHFEQYLPVLGLWLEGDAYPAQDGVTIFFRDITARKNAELELESQTKELQRKSEQLAQSNIELEQFAYAAAHDLQEPLRAVTSETQLLLRAGGLNAEASQSLALINRSADRMRALIRDLLTYSRAVSHPETHFQDVDCQALVDVSLMNCRSALDESRGVVEVGPLPRVIGNASQLAQVFQNLISNATKYRSSVPPCIRIQAQPQNGEWTFSVQDNGMGFDMKYAERIFGVFKRLHGPEIDGTGIGLAICKKIIENHRGRIWAESEPGQGSTFYFTLPRSEQ